MGRTSFLCASLMLLSSSTTLARPHLQTRDFTTWSPPGPGDVRSPCPGLNTLANHGFINHNGQNLTLNMVISGASAAFNIDVPFITFLFSGGLLGSTNPLSGAFNLNDVDGHNFPIEYDGSLSRQDAYFGNATVFDQAIFDSYMAFYDGLDNATIPVASKAKYARVQDSLLRNPQVTYGARELLLSYGNSALTLSVLGDPITGIAPVEYLKVLFEEERLPYNEGWRVPQTQTSLATAVAMMTQLFESSGETLPEGLEAITEGNYKDALALTSVLNKTLDGLTCTILPALCS